MHAQQRSIARCAVMGNPIAHSQSPQIHAKFAAEYGIDLRYEKLLIPRDGFSAAVQDFFADGGRGLNVTLPFKEEAHALATQLSERARRAGAVNTLWMQNGILCGENTDGIGLVSALQQTHHCVLQGKKLLLLGAGGAARGVLLPLINAKVAQIVIVNRSVAKAKQLVEQHLHCGATTLDYAAFDAAPQHSFDIIINATSATLQRASLPLDDNWLQKAATVCYDMNYAHESDFMRWAKNAGAAAVYDGYSMLVAQARASFLCWFTPS